MSDNEPLKAKLRRAKDTAKDRIEELPVVPLQERRPSVDKIGTMMRERPYVAEMVQLQILYDMAGMFEDMLDRMSGLEEKFSKTIPRGDFITRQYEITSSKHKVITAATEGTMPWMTIKIFNDGPNEIYITFSKEKFNKQCSVVLGESLEVDMKTAIIDEVLIYSEGNSTVRIYAKR